MEIKCKIDSPTQVYDGDTIKDVRMEVAISALEVGFFITRDIRIMGIDTPERRPRHKGRTPESIAAEKEAAAAARLCLIEILKGDDFKFTVTDLKGGKYYGRVIARCMVGGFDVAKEMIAMGHAKPYWGGTRPDWEF